MFFEKKKNSTKKPIPQKYRLVYSQDHAYELLMSSTKSMTGHLLGASGGVEGVLTVLSLMNQFALPTINYQVKDPECDLDIVPNQGRKMDTDYAMSNSLGFGGHNASIIFRRAE